MALTPEQKPLLIVKSSEGPGYTQAASGPPERNDFGKSSLSIHLFEHDLLGKPYPVFRIMILDFWPPRQALAAKAEFAFVRAMPKARGN